MREGTVEEVFRREASRVLATLIRLLGDFDLAEEARQEAFAAALEQWPRQGIPHNACAWLIRAGRNKGIDRIRREAVFRSKILDRETASAEANALAEDGDAEDESFGDDRLRLIFTCCHPALNAESQIALTLREVCGLTTQAVARAFFVSEETMAQRLVRAKRKIRDAGIPYETPEPSMLEPRIEGVLAVIYSVFTEGYAATVGPQLMNEELCREAIRLGKLLDALLPDHAAIMGLLALMLLHDARRAARVSSAGNVILLEEQDRSLWDQAQIDEGLALVERSLKKPQLVSHYAVEAAIAALHARSSDKSATDWPQIVGLYEVLLRLHPTPVVELNHAAAVSMVDGPARALDLVDSLAARGEVADYHLLLATRGNLLARLGRAGEAREAFRAAFAQAKLDPERRLLAKRIAELEEAPSERIGLHLPPRARSSAG
ncbi:MAG TPA: RNA polymerase sigma factor [Steroidobacteraceae bacterium]|nr:RNA polymerase sigma factor [Steroidobacteraceae bacterium]